MRCPFDGAPVFYVVDGPGVSFQLVDLAETIAGDSSAKCPVCGRRLCVRVRSG